jgi:autotransporter translocation and assembly factor TamB
VGSLRSALRAVALVVGGLVAAAAIAIGALAIWLQSEGGQRAAGRALSQALSARVRGEVAIGRVSGSVVRSVRLEAVRFRDRDGRTVAEAERVSLSYRLLRLVVRHELDGVRLERPVLHIDQLGHGKPVLLSIDRLVIDGGTLVVRGRPVERLYASGALALGPRSEVELVSLGALVGGHAVAAAASARWSVDGPVDADARLRVDGQPLVLRARIERAPTGPRASALIEGSDFRLQARGELVADRIEGQLEQLEVSPELAARAHLGRRALRASGRIVGPPAQPSVHLLALVGDRALALSASLDLERRSGELSAWLSAGARPVEVRARGALDGRTLVVPALAVQRGETRAHGALRIGSDEIETTLDTRLAPEEAALLGIRPQAPIRARVGLAGTPRALRVRTNARLGAASVALEGLCDLRARTGHARFRAVAVAPSRFVRRAPPLSFSAAFTFDGGFSEGALAGRMSVDDGRLRVAGLRFDRMRGEAAVRLAATGDARVHGLRARLVDTQTYAVSVETAIRWDRRRLGFDVPLVTLGDSRSSGRVVYTSHRAPGGALLQVSAGGLSLSPSLLERLLGRRPRAPWQGEAALEWRPNARALRVDARLGTGAGALDAHATVRGEGGALVVPRLDATLGPSRLRAAGRLHDGQVAAEVEAQLAPSLVHAMVPALAPPAPFRVAGALAGPPGALALSARCTSRAGTGVLSGKVDIPRRRFELVGVLDTLDFHALRPTGTPLRATLSFALGGRLVGRRLVSQVEVRHASGEVARTAFFRGRLDGHLDGSSFDLHHVRIRVPGAIVAAHGRGSFHDFNIHYAVAIADVIALRSVPPSIRVLVGVTHLFPGMAVEGDVRRRDGGKVSVSHRYLIPGLRWIRMLWRLFTGRPPLLLEKGS